MIMHILLQRFPLYNNEKRCDRLYGPCSCGAIHKQDEILQKIEDSYGFPALLECIKILNNVQVQESTNKQNYGNLEWEDYEE